MKNLLKGVGFKRRVLSGAAGLLLVGVVIGVIWFLFLRGGPGDGSDLAGAPPVDPQAEVAQRVEATLTALQPTPTDVPTPDIPATLISERDEAQRSQPLVFERNPLEEEYGNRNPYLAPADLEALEEAGPRMWTYIRIWLELEEIAAVSTLDWSEDLVSNRLAIMVAFRERAGSRSGNYGNVDPVVQEYLDQVEQGFAELRDAMALLAELETKYEEARRELGGDEEGVVVDPLQVRELMINDLDRASRQIIEHTRVYEGIMASYGCSICGELFRSRAP